MAWLLALAAPLAGQEPERRPAEPIPLPAEREGVPPLAGLPAAEIGTGGPWLIEPIGFWGVGVDAYNRIDGLTPVAGLRLDPVDPARAPALALRAGTPTTHHRLYWSLAARQRLPLPGAVVLRIEHAHGAATFDDWKLTRRENDFASLLAARDNLDWWRERGLVVTLDAETAGGGFGASVAFAALRQRSARNRNPFALFGDDDAWRDNPPIEEGRLRAVTVEGRLDTRDVQSPLMPSPGWWIHAALEGAGGPLGGEIEFARGALDVRRFTRLGADAWWDWRILWMGPLGGGDLPPQRRVRLGGPGSLRGFPAMSFEGDAGAQAQTEVRLPLPVHRALALAFLSWHWVGLLDAGAVAEDGRWGDLHADVGAGISGINIFTYVGLFVAQRITDRDGQDGGPRFIVRLRRDF